MNGVYEVVVTTITPNGGATLPFVIPSAVEGSAVQSFGCNEFVIPTGANPEFRVSAVERPAVHSTSTQLNRKPTFCSSVVEPDLQFTLPA